MSRPRRKRRCRCAPEVFFYKPQGARLQSLETIDISLEEFEALRLRYVKKLNQTESASQMNTSQSTFQRILSSALEKTSTAIVTGKAIRISKK
jgi:predicted DNA-binding protein (UPF0251 family)